MLPELVSLCRQTVKLAPRTSIDGFGQITYGTDVSHRARVSGQRKLVLNDQGEEVLSTHTVYLATNPVVGPQDRITLSTGDVQSTETGALQPAILSVGRFPDDQGRSHAVLFLG